MGCIIRKWCKEDARDLAEVMNNKKVQDNLRDGIPYPYTVEDAEEFINAMRAADEDKTYAFAIIADSRVVGSIGAFRCGNIHYRTAELGYYVAEAYWGKGIGTSAIKQISNYIFQKTDIIRIFAEPFSFNIASCRILEKAGFQLEGVLRRNAFKNGKMIDMKMYALVKDE